MQHCNVCGSEKPDNASFCSKCGHTLNQVSTIHEETTNTDASSAKGQRSEDVTMLSTQEPAHSQGAANGHELEGVRALSTQEPENGHQPDDVTEISTQELAHPEDGEREEGDEPGTQLSTPQAIEDEADPPQGEALSPVIASSTPSQPPLQSSISPDPKGRRGSRLRWVLLAIVCILVLAGSAGALVFFLHQQPPATSAAPLVGTSPTSNNSTGITPVNTACPTTTGSKSSTCTSTTTGLTPVAGTKSVFNITFSGAIKGNMTVTSVARCGPSTSGTEYDLYFIGSVGETQYTYVSRVPTYKGPATYGTGQVSVVFAQQPLSTTAVWGNSGNAPATVTINSDLKSGSMEVDLAGASNSVHIAGNWACG